MTTQEKLLNLLHNEVLPDIEDYLDELFEIVASKQEDEDIKEEITYMQNMKKDFTELVNELNAGEIEEDEAQEIIDDIIDMKSIKE